MAKKGTKKKARKDWDRENEGFTGLQKGLLICILSFIPLFLFVLLPLLARHYYVKALKIPEELFLSAPELIELSKTAETEPTYKVIINNVEFKIPNSFSPVNIDINQMEFRNNPKRFGRNIRIKSFTEAQKIEYSSIGFARWFMPSSVLKFMQKILRANWHPARLMFKAQFYAHEGITSKIFEARWDLHHRGFIFPAHAKKGYNGRIFRTNDSGYFEFSVTDEICPVSLEEWINMAMKIKPPNTTASSTAPITPPLQQLIRDSNDELNAPRVLGQALSQFHYTKEPQWLIAVGKILETRGFYAEVVSMHRKFLNQFVKLPEHKDAWNRMLDHTASKILAIEIDPVLETKELNLYCKNLTDSHVGQITIQIIAHYQDGSEKSFITSLLDHGRLFENQERKVRVTTPQETSSLGINKISYKIMQLDFIE